MLTDRASGVDPVVRRVLVCGDRHWLDDGHVYNVLEALKREIGAFWVIQGGATGADRCAHFAALALNLPTVEYPADWTKYGKAAGPIRNRQMLDQEPELVLAFHNHLHHSRGTKDCVEEARRRGIAVRVVTHASVASRAAEARDQEAPHA